MTGQRDWVSTGLEPVSAMPPASPRGLYRFGLEGCREENHRAMICTRPKGHTGRHAASGTTHILAVWE